MDKHLISQAQYELLTKVMQSMVNTGCSWEQVLTVFAHQGVTEDQWIEAHKVYSTSK